jgi:hypothetical protein
MVTLKKKYGKKPIASTAGSDIVESLKADPALTAFSFDGPYPVRDMADLLDNLYCMDNGRYYETPVDFYGLAKAPRQSAWHESALYFKRNVLTGCLSRTSCSIARPFPRLRWTGSRLAMPISNCRVIAWAARFPSNTLLRSTPGVGAQISINTGLSGAGKKSTRSNQERFVTF